MDIRHLLLNDKTYQVIELEITRAPKIANPIAWNQLPISAMYMAMGTHISAVPTMGTTLAKPVRNPENKILGAPNIQ